jgi:hypothetical protein
MDLDTRTPGNRSRIRILKNDTDPSGSPTLGSYGVIPVLVHLAIVTFFFINAFISCRKALFKDNYFTAVLVLYSLGVNHETNSTYPVQVPVYLYA